MAIVVAFIDVVDVFAVMLASLPIEEARPEILRVESFNGRAKLRGKH